MKVLKMKWIFALGLVLGMSSGNVMAFETLSFKPVIDSPRVKRVIDTVDIKIVVRDYDLKVAASEFCNGETQCMDELFACVTGPHNQFGCEAGSDADDGKYACEVDKVPSTDSGESVEHALIEKCNDVKSLGGRFVIPQKNLPALADRVEIDVVAHPVIIDPDFIHQAGRKLIPPTLHRIDPQPTTPGSSAGDGSGDNGEMDAGGDSQVLRPGQAVGEEGDIDVGTGQPGNFLQGGCSLTPGSEPFALTVWIPNLMLVLAPLAWALGKKK